MRRKTGLSPPVIITTRPKVALSLRFDLFHVRCCSAFKCFNFEHFCVSHYYILVKLTELPPIWERAANSAYHLLFRCLLRYVCSSFSLMFRTSFGY